MPTSIAGALFTVKLASVAYSSQVMDGSVDGSTNVVTEFTLGPNQVETATSKVTTVTINGLYDGSAGIYDALWAAFDGLSTVAIEIADGTAKKFSGSVLVESLNLPFGAEDSSKFSCSLRGPLTRASYTP